jgi:hypothetical protein
MPIRRQTDEERDLTVFVLEDEVTAEELSSCLTEFWERGPITRFVLWKGMEGATIGRLTADQIRAASRIVRRYGDRMDQRTGGKSAIVAVEDIDFGLARMFEAMHKSGGPPLPYDVKVFRDETEALEWFYEK